MGNIALKIVALIFGILLWFLVISQKDFQLTLDVPLTFVKIPDNMAIASKPPRTIKITMEGKSWDLIRLRNAFKSGNTNVIAMVVDLQKAELGPKRIPLDAENFTAPGFPGVRFLDPENHLLFVDLDIDTRISRSVPVRSKIAFNPAQGYLLADEPKITPDEIQVAGARNTIAKIIDLPTDSLSYDTLTESSLYTVPLSFTDFPAFVTPSDSSVQIEVNIQRMTSKTFKHIPVNLIGFYDHNKYVLIPDTVTVEITGGVNALDSITDKDIELLMEFNRFAIEDVDSLQPTVKLTLPASVNRDMAIKATQLKPDKVSLNTIEKTEEEPMADLEEDSQKGPSKKDLPKKKAEEAKK